SLSRILTRERASPLLATYSQQRFLNEDPTQGPRLSPLTGEFIEVFGYIPRMRGHARISTSSPAALNLNDPRRHPGRRPDDAVHRGRSRQEHDGGNLLRGGRPSTAA